MYKKMKVGTILFTVVNIVAAVTLSLFVEKKIKEGVEMKTSFKFKDNRFIYVYNPAIIAYRGDVLVVSRASGHIDREREKLCITYDIDSISHNDVKSFFEVFPEKDTYSSSTLVTWFMRNPTNKRVLVPNVTQDQLCDIKYPGYEDPRLFYYENEPWVICYFRGKRNHLNCGHNVIMFSVFDDKKSLILSYKSRNEIEKNWMPFEYGGSLYIVYSVFPHHILKVNTKTGECVDVYITHVPRPTFKFNHGVGGGSPPVLVYFHNRVFWLSMAHTRGGPPVTRKNFFYAFEHEPPFRILAVGKEFDIDHKHIEFGCGMIVTETEIILSLGVDDCYGKIVTYNKIDVLNELLSYEIKRTKTY